MSEVVRRGGRIEWLDSARGIAIILVVLGHCIGYIDEPLNKVILSFHMPCLLYTACGEVGVRILFMPESTEGVSEGQTTAMSGENH